MKNRSINAVILLLASLFMSCETSQLECIRASSTMIAETRDLKDFTGVVFNNWGDLYLTQGPEYSFAISGPDNVIELTTTEIKNEVLIIGSETCFNGSYDIKVEITAPDYDLINLVGGGRVFSAGVIDADNISVEAYGTGEIELEIVADTLYTSMSGQVDLNYSGGVLSHQLINSGNFVLNGYSLETDYTTITNNGTGASYVTAYESLTVNINGNGNVYYKGNPEVVSKIIGVGEIIDAN